MEDMIFVEKYRPKKFSDVIGCPKELSDLITQGMPHLLFEGSAGTGKTTTALIIKDVLDADFLKLNASDERGIDVIRGKVKSFAMTKGMKEGIKVVLLDEADFLTNEAQAILRGVVEEYSANCRFILTCVSSGTKIYTPYGYKVVENIGKDYIYTEKGCSYNRELIKRKRKRVVNIRTKYGFDIKVTPEHKFFIGGEWVEASMLGVGDRIDISLKSMYGSCLELDNSSYRVFNDSFIDSFRDFLIKKKVPSRKLLEYNYSLFKNSVFPQCVDLYNRMSKGTVYDIFDVMSLYDSPLPKYRYNQMLSSLIKNGYVRKYGHYKYVRVEKDIYSDNSRTIVKKINDVYGYDYNYREVYNLYKAKSHIKTIEDVIDSLYTILSMKSDDYDLLSSFCRLVGFIYGDGHLGSNVNFAGGYDCMELVRNDLSKFFSFDNKIKKNGYQDGKGYCFSIGESSLVYFLEYIGCPLGQKVGQCMSIPDIMYKSKFMMKFFIQSLFDCESLTLKVIGDKKTIYPIRFMQMSTKYGVGSYDNFFGQIKYVLRDMFGIESVIRYNEIEKGDEYKVKGKRVEKFLYIAKGCDKVRYFEMIGNYYEKKKITYDFYGYLKYKQKENCFGYDFLNFYDWKNTYYSNGILFDEVSGIDVVDGSFDVYDLSLSDVHSYISNGFISHNCNHLSRISEAIQSRCKIFSFRNMQKEDIKQRLKEICEKEKITFLEKDLDVIVDKSGTDIRRAINNLQVCSSTGLLNIETLQAQTTTKDLIELIRRGDLDVIRKKYIDESPDYEEVLNQLSLEIMKEPIVIDNKNKAIKIIAEAMFRMSFTLNKEIQFSYAISEIIGMRVLK